MKKIIRAALLGLMIGGGFSAKIGQLIAQSNPALTFDIITVVALVGSLIGVAIGISLTFSRDAGHKHHMMKVELPKETKRQSA